VRNVGRFYLGIRSTESVVLHHPSNGSCLVVSIYSEYLLPNNRTKLIRIPATLMHSSQSTPAPCPRRWTVSSNNRVESIGGYHLIAQSIESVCRIIGLNDDCSIPDVAHAIRDSEHFTEVSKAPSIPHPLNHQR
jgi:hypothetical protein